MFIAYKKSDKNLIARRETEWQCRMNAKGIDLTAYNAWIKTITTQDEKGNDVVTYPSEDFTIVECRDEDVSARLNQLSDYININRKGGELKVYNIKWQDDIGNAEEILDADGKSQSPKVYVQSHLIPDDTAKDARLLSDEWTRIRAERDRLIAETDWMMLSDTGTVSTAWKNYRKALREIPQSQDSVKKFSDIDWPDKPSS